MNYCLILAILLIFGILSTRLIKLVKLPNVTAFLITGLIIGVVFILMDNLGYSNEFHQETLNETLNKLNGFVSSIALGFIALSIGEEFKWDKIKKLGKKVIIITFFQALAAVILVDAGLLIVCSLLNVNLSVAVCLGAIATATAPAATLMVIHQYKAKGDLVDLLLPVVALDDAIGLIVFAISVAIGKTLLTGSEISFVSVALIPLIEIFGSIILGFILGLLMHVVIKFFKSRANHLISIIAFTLLGVGLCEALNHITINGETLEFSNLLCCMMIGAVFVNFYKPEEEGTVNRDIDIIERWAAFLFTLFFVLSGAHLASSSFELFKNNQESIGITLIIFALYIVLRSSGKYFGSMLGCEITRQPKHVKKYLGLTLLPQAGVAIGMANSISNMECFKGKLEGNIIVIVVLCATLIYELFGPLLTKFALIKANQIPKEE